MQNKNKWQESHKWQELPAEDIKINDHIAQRIAGNSALVAILEHHGKLTVPRKNFMELVDTEQVWPNDFIYNHGSSMAITYDAKTDEMGFELRYSSDGNHPENLVAYVCTRNSANVGFVDHDSPLYKD